MRILNIVTIEILQNTVKDCSEEAINKQLSVTILIIGHGYTFIETTISLLLSLLAITMIKGIFLEFWQRIFI